MRAVFGFRRLRDQLPGAASRINWQNSQAAVPAAYQSFVASGHRSPARPLAPKIAGLNNKNAPCYPIQTDWEHFRHFVARQRRQRYDPNLIFLVEVVLNLRPRGRERRRKRSRVLGCFKMLFCGVAKDMEISCELTAQRSQSAPCSCVFYVKDSISWLAGAAVQSKYWCFVAIVVFYVDMDRLKKMGP